MKYFLAFLLAFIVPSAAMAACYSQEEFEAEQGLRIHSELMVISLNCQSVSHSNGNLYVQYKDFTRQHASLLAGYEQTLVNFYTRNGYRNPEAEINGLRTDLANKISNDAARMKPNVFCKVYADRILQALRMDEPKLRRWAATPFSGYPVSFPICAKG